MLTSDGWTPLVMMSGGGFLQLISFYISFRTSTCRSLGIVILLSVANPVHLHHVFLYMVSHVPLLLCIFCVLYRFPHSVTL